MFRSSDKKKEEKPAKEEAKEVKKEVKKEVEDEGFISPSVNAQEDVKVKKVKYLLPVIISLR